MESLQAFMAPAIARIVRPAPLSVEKVLFAWRMAVGGALARVSRVTLRDDGVLVATLEDARWRPEIERSAQVILGRLQELLGADVVGSLELVAPLAPSGPARRATRITRRKSTL